MKLLIALACVAVSSGQLINNWAGYGYNAWSPYGMATPYAAAAPMMRTASLHPAWSTMAAPMSTMMGSPAGHAFSYNDGWSTRSENSLLGATSGSYSYIDGDGKLQTVNYKADEGGFRAEGTNLPVMKMAAPMPVQDTPEVAAAKAEFMAKFREAEMNSRQKRSLLVGLSHTPASTAPLFKSAIVSSPLISPYWG